MPVSTWGEHRSFIVAERGRVTETSHGMIGTRF